MSGGSRLAENKSRTIRKATVCFLAAAVLAGMNPGRALAADLQQWQAAGVKAAQAPEEAEAAKAWEKAEAAKTWEKAEAAKTTEESKAAQAPEEMEPAEETDGKTDGAEHAAETAESKSESQEAVDLTEIEAGDDRSGKGPETEENQEPETVLPGTGGAGLMDLVIPVVIPITEGAEYDQLSSFLTLSADRFEIYTVAFINIAQQPVQPEEPQEIALEIPSDYDVNRTVVSEISVTGDLPQRTELDFEIRDGKAVFSTDHMGIYVVMEKTVYAELPGRLEPTAKVEGLELKKRIPAAVTMTGYGGTAVSTSISAVPSTGDDFSAGIWIGVMAAAAAVAIVVIVVIVKRRKK